MILVGETIGPFYIEKEIGNGAMGSVYRARYSKGEGPGRPVAIKVIASGLGDNERIQARFQREADILKQLKHPNIVRLLATGKYQKNPFYAMEFIDGESMDAVLERHGKFHWEKVIEFGKQICAALQHAHENGIIHRDLKPSNLMIQKDGTIKLTDFGIAKDSDMTGLTSVNSTVGTAAYMSPEQCRGERLLTAKSDLYSLGIVLYELLTGRKPFHAENSMDMFLQHVSGAFERPSRIILDIPPWFDTLVCQLMEKKADNRPVDAAAVSKAMDEVKSRVDAHKSLGIEVANKVARKGATKKDRDAAQTIVNSKRRGRKVRNTKEKIQLTIKAIGLMLAFAGVCGILFLVLRPESNQKLFKKAEEYLAAGEGYIKDGKFYDAHENLEEALKYLNKTKVEKDTEDFKKYELLRDRRAAAELYRKGHEKLSIKKDDWKTAMERGYDELLKMTNPGAQEFVEKARDEIANYHAPVLRDTVFKKSNVNQEIDWEEARIALATLTRLYPKSKEAIEVADVKLRLEAQKNISDRFRDAREKQRDPETAQIFNDYEKMAIEAMKFETKGDSNAALTKWKEIVERSKERKQREDLDFKPWILIAEAKLQAAGTGEKKEDK